jgi:HD superfamily phosphohydrolase
MNALWRIRDPIFGFISLDETEVGIINTPIFQRLRGIKQLALARLVYPSALHTRFEHSIGTCHVAQLMAKKLRLSKNQEKLVRLAALLHDIGHGPFSHVSEDILELFSNVQMNSKTGEIHEAIGREIIQNDSGLKKLISPKDAENIVKLLETGIGEPTNRAIISGPLDADKQDYLLRDSYFCGVQYGVFDHEQLIREIVKIEDEMGDRENLGISLDGIHALEQFVLAKYFITTQVYRHRVRLITDQMLIRAVKLGIEIDGNEDLRKLYTYDKSDDFISNYTRFNDSFFMHTFCDDNDKDCMCHKMLSRLKKRNLLKSVFKKSTKDLNLKLEVKEQLDSISKPENKKLRRKLEHRIYELVQEHLLSDVKIDNSKTGQEFVIVNSYEMESVKKKLSDESQILVKTKPPRLFQEESALFRSISEPLKERYIEVYVPVKYNTEEEKEKEDLKKSLDKPIISLFKSFLDTKGGKDHEN